MSLHHDGPEFAADADTKDCAECGAEFIPKRPGQEKCARAACNGAQGAKMRKYKGGMVRQPFNDPPRRKKWKPSP